ncbi:MULTISPECIES: hypothetical protein [Pseudanabaena]|uniref:Uncharacterized protein n=2 Tax=Pseudanabaena TaxID=1152 RepID=L8MX62_9CYAN|nr:MULTISPECIES: hypothetical protein [Pseudanabaena]ELS31050.1 hypothetical protein Pse7429DRAFT_3650 [Pseudanabaena biceps PCC 7429]MDG3496685.1 hypothetical protein [Pseudanabaena catenata USMAC16]
MQTQRALSAVGLWWRWVLTTLVGTLIGSMFGIAACLAGVHFLSFHLIQRGICHTGFGSLNCSVATGIVCGAMAESTFVGLMQYVVLRRFLKSPAWWILASTFSWTWIAFAATSLAYTAQFGFAIDANGGFVESNIFDRIPILAANSLWVVLAGILLGVLQWLVLWNGRFRRPSHVQFLKRRSLLWIVVNFVLIAFLPIAIIPIFRGQGTLYGILLFFLGFSPIYATITAATLVKIQLHKLNKLDVSLPLSTSNEISS